MNINFSEMLAKIIPNQQEREKISQRLRAEYSAELNRPPKIAVFGPTGVGKTSTINSLFGTNLSVSHTSSGTKAPTIANVDGSEIDGHKGSIIFYDMPGIGEDLARDEQYKDAYAEIMAKCDVALWVLSAIDRRIAYDQMIIRDVLAPANQSAVDRIVIGVNKVDLLHPNDWLNDANLPSLEQEDTLHERIADIRMKIEKVVPKLDSEHIIGYSAAMRYRLPNLFTALMQAMPPERAWVLKTRESIADFWELVDPNLRSAVIQPPEPIEEGTLVSTSSANMKTRIIASNE